MTRKLDRRTLLRSAALGGLACAAPRLAWAEDKPPVAPIRPVTENLFGVEVTDPYRWMEAEGPEWKSFVEAEGAYTRRVLDAIPGRDGLVRAVGGYTRALVSVASVQTGGSFIFTEVRPAGADTFKLYVRDGVEGRDRLLVDSDTFAVKGGHASLDWWAASPDGSHVVFGTSPGGSENSTARILVTATGALLPETIDRTEDASPSWAPDGSGFFYNRLQAGVAGDSLDKYKLSTDWWHRLNTDPARDVRVLAKSSSQVVPLTDADFPNVTATAGSQLVVGAVISGVQNELALFAAALPQTVVGAPDWRPICTPADKVTNFAVRGDELYLLSHQGASRFQVLKASGADPGVHRARVVVPESTSVIRGMAAARDGLYLQDLNAGLGGLRRLAPDGAIMRIALPFQGAVSGLYADTLHDGAWFFLRGWVKPTVLCHVTPDGVVTQTDIAPQPAIDVSSYTSEETFATAKDGAQIPLSIVYRKGLKRDGSAPLLLEAYGAYGITLDPGFLARWLPLLDLGGVFAVAHVRGGGELGEDWHLAGQKLNKPNTWRDTIAAAEHLIAQRYTSTPRLAVIGGSAGGITMGRFLTERPDLAAVVISQVGVSNALRSEFSPNGPPNIPEFGTVTEPQGFKALYAMDALQHVRDGVRYPSVLLTTGLNDPRVSSWEPTKMAARLQAANASTNPILLRIETDAGHGIGSTRGQVDRETGDILAFMLWRTGQSGFQPKR